MSTNLQLKGDSRRRQLELSKAYAAEHNLDLADDSQLEDIGISAFKGANIKGGSLGHFLEAIKHGKISPGSYLLVESLDRLSRQEVRKSLTIFLSIIDAGINIVTLGDNRTYTADKTETLELITSLVIMSRAHEESQTKSHRLSAAWSNKRAHAKSRPLTATCPAWLRLSADRTHFEIIEDRAEIVRAIFEDTISGIGNYSITRRLNEKNVPCFGKSRGWHNSYIAKILNNRAVVGEFLPHKLVDGKRRPDGEPIKGYYPTVVDEQLFFKAQAARNQRSVRGGGRKGAKISNLFSKIAFCAYCKARMRFENKGAAPKGSSYLVCEGGKRGMPCQTARWRYDNFETSFLAFVQELDLETMAQSNDEANKRILLDDSIRSLQGEMASIKMERERIYQLLLRAETATAFVEGKMQECERRLSTIEQEIATKEKELSTLASKTSKFYESKEEIKLLIDRLQNPNDRETYKLRSQIASRLSSLVSSVVVAPLGHAPSTRQLIGELKDDPSTRPELELIDFFQQRLLEGRENWPYFMVVFKDGNVRIVYASRHDPLQFEEQVEAVDGGITRLEKSGIQKILTPSRADLAAQRGTQEDHPDSVPSSTGKE